MSSARLIKRRIKTTKNIRQITKAMEMVAASKMRRAQDQALGSKPYANKLQAALRRIAAITESDNHPLLQQNRRGHTAILIISPNKGLTGGLNTNLFRQVDQYTTALTKKTAQIDCIIVGKKARDYIAKTDLNVLAEFSDLPENISFSDSLPISKLILDGYTQKKFKSVHIIFMDFISTLVQRAQVNQLLPISIEAEPLPDKPDKLIETELASRYEYIFEPTASEVLDWILPYYVEMQIYQTLLEARASEHSARMVSMKSASDNAKEIITDLTLAYNKSRQAGITSELLDIISSSMSAN